MAKIKGQTEDASRSYVRLFREDLDKIEEILRNLDDAERPFPSYYISTQEVEGESVSDLVSAETSTRIRTYAQGMFRPAVGLRVSPRINAYVSCRDITDLQAKGAFSEIVRILERARLPLVARVLARLVAVALGAGAAFGTSFGFIVAIARDIEVPTFTGTVMSLAGLASLALLYLWQKLVSPRGIVFLEARGDRSNFWRRNRDQLVIQTFVVLGTAVLTALATLAVTH